MSVADIHSTSSDYATRQWDDTALVTCMLDQTYTVGGEPMAIQSPVSIVYRRVGDAWRIALIHAVPLSTTS